MPDVSLLRHLAAIAMETIVQHAESHGANLMLQSDADALRDAFNSVAGEADRTSSQVRNSATPRFTESLSIVTSI